MRAVAVLFFLWMVFGAATKYSKIGIPPHFPKPYFYEKILLLDSSTIELGRLLFYDPNLSADSSISCASCHSPYNAFAHTDHKLSHGIQDQIGTRNAPALFNLAWSKNFMWDGSILHLDLQALSPINHPKEMAETTANVVKKISQSSLYPHFFYKAFGDSAVSGEKLVKALAQFQFSLISANSKYDQVKVGLNHFSDQEQRGYTLFKENCNHCHTEPLFSNFEIEKNKLKVDSDLQDLGKFQITNEPRDSFGFKVPSLRNLSYSYPYMHDGRFQYLSEVLEHYSNQTLTSMKDSLNKTIEINLNSNEKIDLISFLLTLNDTSFVFNPAYHFPKSILKR
ncbi:MAG TPA: cytochrome c peroxidase [Saprospiraceae bacterium]|nr:cytochrome c peroxidase [Saprospiraceae bacterium]